MASRRMKMKVAVNVGRSGAAGRSSSGGPSSGSDRPRPGTPVGTSNDGCSSDSTLAIPSDNTSMTAPRSPIKHFSSLHFPSSPTKRHAYSIESPTPRTLSESEAEEDSSAFQEEDESAFCLVAVSPLDSEIASPAASRSSSPVKHGPSTSTCTTVALIDQFRRGPGTGPPINPSTSSNILNNIQKEIGPVHVSHVASNDTLRQRLQKGTGSVNSKYAVLRKEFMATTKNKTPDKKDLTILHFTFWNPPGDDEPKTSDVDTLYEGIDTSTMRVARFHTPASPPPIVVDLEEEPPKSIGPRVKVGPDGELIIDEQSLVVETSESIRAKKQLEDMETVMAAGSGYYRHKRFPKRGYDWTVKETVRFFKALTMCGTDFSMMSHLFPNRSRAELKAKFKREDRKNSQLVSQALAFQTFDPMEPLTESEESDDEDAPPRKRRFQSNHARLRTSSEIKKVEGVPSSDTAQPIRRKSIDVISDTASSPQDTASTPLAIEYYPTKVKTEKKSAKLLKKKGIKLEKVSNLPEFVPGRPMGLGDCTKIKKLFKKDKKEKLANKTLDADSSTENQDEVSDKRKRKTTKAEKKLKSENPQKKPKNEKKKAGKRTSKTEEDTEAISNSVEQEPIADSSLEVSSPVVNENTREASPDPRLALLRFDADDPLGLKVVQGQGQEEVTAPAPGQNQDATISEIAETSSCSEDALTIDLPATSNTIELQIESDSLKQAPPPAQAPPPKERKSVKVKVKPRIPRVPGGGGPLPRGAGDSQVQGVDEIEIEISC